MDQPHESFTLHRGNRPLLVSIPHLGTRIPADVQARMAPEAAVRQDTDWHLDRLYEFAAGMGATVLSAQVSRYVVDLNRPPSGDSLYPGQTTTGLFPTETFRGVPLYPDGGAPDATEQARRLEAYWRPYHAMLQAEIDRLRSRFANVVLWEAHSIASVLPRLFDGKLPDLNFGTNGGRSCDPALTRRVLDVAARLPFTQAHNERFKGGYITRQYGIPASGVHAIQLEMCQYLYMDEAAPFGYRPDRAKHIQPGLQAMLESALAHVDALR